MHYQFKPMARFAPPTPVAAVSLVCSESMEVQGQEIVLPLLR